MMLAAPGSSGMRVSPFRKTTVLSNKIRVCWSPTAPGPNAYIICMIYTCPSVPVSTKHIYIQRYINMVTFYGARLVSRSPCFALAIIYACSAFHFYGARLVSRCFAPPAIYFQGEVVFPWCVWVWVYIYVYTYICILFSSFFICLETASLASRDAPERLLDSSTAPNGPSWRPPARTNPGPVKYSSCAHSRWCQMSLQ